MPCADLIFTPGAAISGLTAIGPAAKFTRILNNKMAFDVGFNRSGYWWPDFAWTHDVRRLDLTTT